MKTKNITQITVTHEELIKFLGHDPEKMTVDSVMSLCMSDSVVVSLSGKELTNEQFSEKVVEGLPS